MSLFFLAYILNLIGLTYVGIKFLKNNFYLFGMYFFIFCFCTGVWFVLYQLTYYSTNNHEILEYISRSSYAISIIAIYSFILFVYYFGRKIKIQNQSLSLYVCVSLLLLYIYNFSPFIVDGFTYLPEKNDWYENLGKYFWVHLSISYLFFPIIIFVSYRTFKRLHLIERKRLEIILAGYVLFVFSAFFILLFLAEEGIWIFERYIAFFIIPFIVSVLYSIRRYDFLDIKIFIKKILRFAYAGIVSYGLIIFFKSYIGIFFGEKFKDFWGYSEHLVAFDIFLLLILFFIINHFLIVKFPLYFSDDGAIQKSLIRLKHQISLILDFQELNFILNSFFTENGYSGGYLFIDNVPQELVSFFSKKKFSYFLNQDVFIDENNCKNIGDIIHKKIYILFPLYDIDYNISGYFGVGEKKFSDPFSQKEIEYLLDFSKFLELHTRYLGVYSQLQEFTIFLDKKVDEKTIEYNTLLTKQKEFIRYLSHEIKNPLTNTIFLADDIKNTYKDEDTQILYTELIKISELVKKVFTTEKFDLEKIKFIKKKLPLTYFFQNILSVIESTHPEVKFNIQIENTLPEREIDEIQFTQVIHNLVSNALKFAHTKNPKITFIAKNISENIYIEVHDNGKGFSYSQGASIFDKYSTGDGNSVGLGLGLYLCKKIVELHGGKISAENSSLLSGAVFTIIL